MFEEALELITTLLRTENVRYQGRYWNLPETTTLPRPITRPHPQFWRATSSVPTMAWSLERGIKVITGGTSSSMDRIINNWHLFQDAVEAARVTLAPGVHYPPGRVRLGHRSRRQGHAAPRCLAYADGPWPVLQYFARQRRPGDDRTDRPHGQEDDPAFLYKDWFFGTPEIVAEKIYRMTQYIGVTYLNCTFNIGQIPHHKVMRSMELFATRVMPHFRTICRTRRNILAGTTPLIPKGTSHGRKACH